jgi:hypothetical protein
MHMTSPSRGFERFCATAGDSVYTALSPPLLFLAIGDVSSSTCYSGAPVVYSFISILDEHAGTTSVCWWD